MLLYTCDRMKLIIVQIVDNDHMGRGKCVPQPYQIHFAVMCLLHLQFHSGPN